MDRASVWFISRESTGDIGTGPRGEVGQAGGPKPYLVLEGGASWKDPVKLERHTAGVCSAVDSEGRFSDHRSPLYLGHVSSCVGLYI